MLAPVGATKAKHVAVTVLTVRDDDSLLQHMICLSRISLLRITKFFISQKKQYLNRFLNIVKLLVSP